MPTIEANPEKPNFLQKIWEGFKRLSKKIQIMVVIALLTLITSLITLFFPINDYLEKQKEKSEIVVLKKDLIRLLNQIESDINPYDIPKDLLLIEDIRMIQEFESSLKTAIVYRSSIENEPKFRSFKDKSIFDILAILNDRYQRYHEYLMAINNIKIIINNIKNYGITHGITLYDINDGKWKVIKDNLDLWESTLSEAFDKTGKYINSLQSKNSPSYIPTPDEFEKMFKPFDDLSDNVNYYKFEVSFYDYALELDKYYRINIDKKRFNF